MMIEIEFWHLVGLFLSFLGCCFTFGKLLLSQFQHSLNERYQHQEKVNQKVGEIERNLHKAMPYSTSEQFLKEVVGNIYPEVTELEIRQQLEYLSSRKLVDLNKQPHGMWFADINRLGIDVVEYTIDCQAGIARPEKYWA